MFLDEGTCTEMGLFSFQVKAKELGGKLDAGSLNPAVFPISRLRNRRVPAFKAATMLQFR